MKLTGEFLKINRSQKKINLKTVSEDLHISLGTLQDIENDNFPKHIDKVFLLGHIRSYAKYLNLNPDEVTNSFKNQISYNNTSLLNEISKPINNFQLFSLPRALSYFSVLFAVIGFYALFLRSNDFQSEYAMTPNVPENLASNLEEVEMNMILLDKSQNKSKSLTSYQQNDIKDNQSNLFINSSSAIASFQNKENTQQLDGNILLQFLNPTWIQIRNASDEIVHSKLMDKGDEYSYTINNNYTLTAGNAGNIIISLDNIVLGKAGKIGEVVDSLIVDKHLAKN